MDLSLALPAEVLWIIAKHLNPPDLRALGTTNHMFHALAHDDSLWHAVYAGLWPGSRPHLPAEGKALTWRSAVERRERALRWATLLAAEGQEEPSSLIANTRRRFDYFAQLVALLAEPHSDEAKQIRALGVQLAHGILESTLASVIDTRHPHCVVRLAFITLADLAFEEQAIGRALQVRLATQRGGLYSQCFTAPCPTRSMAAAYLHAAMGLSVLDVKGTNLKVPATLLPVERFDEEQKLREAAQEENDPTSAQGDGAGAESQACHVATTAATRVDVHRLCQVLNGSWRGYNFDPRADTYNEEIITLAFTEGGVVTGRGKDKFMPFRFNGSFCFDTGLLHVTKQYYTHSLPYRGRLNANGFAGAWGNTRWGGSFVIWRNSEDTQKQGAGLQE